VGGAYIADVLEAASGLNLWREWARIEVEDIQTKQKLKSGQKRDCEGEVKKPNGKITPIRNEYAGIVLSLAKQEYPDTTSYDDPEIAYRVKKRHHAGLIVRSKKLERVEELLAQYAARFAEDFIAVVPPLERAE
jgi:hypothetical protein